MLIAAGAVFLFQLLFKAFDLFVFNAGDPHFAHIGIMSDLENREFTVLFYQDGDAHSQHGQSQQYNREDK